ncbi:MAG: c-type cytochrome [Alphaproteobacteria bacterium]|nr:c-type cytochrome [Alphaproteobacteria bacterium]
MRSMKIAVALGALAAIAAGASAFAQGTSDPGERAFSFCFSCHSVDANQTETLSGPNLAGIIGRPVASKAGFEYTEALKEYGKGKTWTPELILQWIQDPRKMVPGTEMSRPPGPRTDADRAALINYLKAH